VIGGNAGAIPALLALAANRGRERCRSLAISLGEELCKKADRRDSVWAPEVEPDSSSTARRDLHTGLSHGAAGIGLALLELYRETGRTGFLEAGRAVFEHEDTSFDRQQANWADRRDASGKSIYERTWCRGAPGIALSRIRAAALDADRATSYQDMGRLAIGTTLDAVDKNLAHWRHDASLCHGLSGLGDIVLVAGQMLDDDSYRERALALGADLIERYSASGDWPSGVGSGGPNPSLMLGLAGIGYWFLRLHDPLGIPPFLLLIPESYEGRSTRVDANAKYLVDS
jgi:lantibiotic biosynthesis protein